MIGFINAGGFDNESLPKGSNLLQKLRKSVRYVTSWPSAVYDVTLVHSQFATSPWLFLLLSVQLLMGSVHGAISNWYAHR